MWKSIFIPIHVDAALFLVIATKAFFLLSFCNVVFLSLTLSPSPSLTLAPFSHFRSFLSLSLSLPLFLIHFLRLSGFLYVLLLNKVLMRFQKTPFGVEYEKYVTI